MFFFTIYMLQNSLHKYLQKLLFSYIICCVFTLFWLDFHIMLNWKAIIWEELFRNRIVFQSIVFHVEHHPDYPNFLQCVMLNSFSSKYQEQLYVFMGMVMMYLLPLVVIIFCYSSIVMEIFRRSRDTDLGELPLRNGFWHSILDFNRISKCFCFYFFLIYRFFWIFMSSLR